MLAVVGTAFRVERTNFGGQLASGEGVTLDCRKINKYFLVQATRRTFGGRIIDGGAESISATLKGWLMRSVV